MISRGRFKIEAVLFLLGLTLTASSHAQTPTKCPNIRLDSGNVGKRDVPEIYYVTLEPTADSLTPNYSWSLSQGKIISGQGTNRIELRRNENLVGQPLTVTVEITGLPTGCESKVSETSSLDPPLTAAKFYEIAGPLGKAHKTRFENIVSVINANPQARLLIAVSGSKKFSNSSIAAKKQVLIKEVYSRLKEDSRTIFIELKTNDDRIEFWLVPAGANIPYSQLEKTKP